MPDLWRAARARHYAAAARFRRLIDAFSMRRERHVMLFADMPDLLFTSLRCDVFHFSLFHRHFRLFSSRLSRPLSGARAVLPAEAGLRAQARPLRLIAAAPPAL
jgi:hypothetical protein